MTREEAADYLRPIMESATLTRYQEALRLAVEALEGRADKSARRGAGTLDRSRWEGCEFCQTELPEQGPCVSACNSFNIGNKRYMPKFCPVCGRPLTAADWAELERRMNGGTDDK